MRHNDARKWLHAGLDLLPLILIPVFMIYSHRHTIDSGSIQVQEKISVDFNQLLNLDNISYVNNGITIETNGVSIHAYGTCTGSFNYVPKYIDVLNNHKYMLTNLPVNMPISNRNVNSFQIYGANVVNIWIGEYQSTNYSTGYAYNDGVAEIRFRFDSGESYDLEYEAQIYDLTQMGLEDISYQEFKTIFPQNSYPYTKSHKELINGDLVTYDNTDIMSQFTYQMYNAVDKYFNMGNVFGLNNVYQWFELNIFGGSAPIYIYIVWQIVLYEFVMDLLFLLYGLFMWFIDMCKHLMEKPFKSIK